MNDKQHQNMIDQLVEIAKNGKGWSTEDEMDELMPPKKKKRKVASGYETMTIAVMANGYMAVVNDCKGPENTYVFPNMKALQDWIKDNIAPTYKNADFMEKL